LFRSRETGFKGLWECKLTPAYGACQERNTTGCILNNDGLDAGVGDLFSTRGIHGAFTIVGEGLRGQFFGLVLGKGERAQRLKSAIDFGIDGSAKAVP
jgi:hypothetical protein